MNFTRKYYLGNSLRSVKVFAFMLSISTLTFLSACKEEKVEPLDVNDYIGTYIGLSIVTTPVTDTSGATTYQTTSHKDTAIVAPDSLVQYGVIISGANLGAPYGVVLTDEAGFSTGTNSQALNGQFTVDSVHYSKRCGLPCNSWFDGKKQ